MTTTKVLRRVAPTEISRHRHDPVDAQTVAQAAAILADVRADGLAAVRRHAERLGDVTAGAPMIVGRDVLTQAERELPADQRAVLVRVAERIRAFAEAQRASITDLRMPVLGGEAGHWIAPVERAGCYAPGGRFPLPSSVLMTAVTARAAGVQTVWVASPRPTAVTLAAASIAGADALLAVGGAQAIAALALGAGDVPACDAVVGPGNRWVTAAKQLVAGRVAIDMLAGPSELLIVADGTADPAVVAADLLAQAEHDTDALPILVTTSAALADAVDAELARQLATLPTAETARAALRENGFAVVVDSVADAVAIADELAPEHLQLHLADADAIAPTLRHYGALFVGSGAAEVFGDYGIGPNHTLPTGGTARISGGLSVLTFLRVRTWLRVPQNPHAEMLADTAALARLEGLEAHARAAEIRALLRHADGGSHDGTGG